MDKTEATKATVQPQLPTGGSVADVDRFIELVRNIHPTPALRRTQRAAQEPQSTRLPLRAFRVAMVFQLPGRPDEVLLRSKDPAHDETYLLSEGGSDRDAQLISIRYERRFGHFRVRRGEEEFTFPFDFGLPVRGGGGIREATAPRRPLAKSPQPKVRGEIAPAGSPNIKGVPFFGEDGKVIGFRVSGLRKESAWTRLGLRPGDVILSADDEAVSDVRSLRDRIREGWRPNAVTITRVTDVTKARKTVHLTRG